ncbi:carbohydrate ABC transporter permease [Microbacterium ulmi]|uniref:Carbohydrate ABC transporter permease n=1 Tax=Microbacterium ulmi TaxID=179095 RepID=A0A7Y2LZP7_9MICO|nr:carbohydrate ABC transporter permease [Microbacterium ulmi]NII69921.1 multiple sugar transport system permease protein [Microbacterium ulmi]NNH03841.1 carbohydrate ABC transporter permease [Microbacterium ulmi]
MTVFEHAEAAIAAPTTRTITTHTAKRPRRVQPAKERGVISVGDRKRRTVRVWLWIIQALTLVGLVFAGLGPLAWSAKAAISDSYAIITDPMGIWFTPNEWGNLIAAWNAGQIGPALGNTVALAVGSTVVTLFVCTTGAYLLSALRPRWGKVLSAAILATLFLPGVISLVPLYLTILNLPVLNVSLINTYWAVWLPAGASAFNVLILKQFFDSIPRELVEAARIDGAGPVRVFATIILPLSRPILGVVALLTIVASWKDFLWPMLVLPDSALQPVSVALPHLAKGSTPFAVQMAAVFLSIIIPIVLFLVFQKQFLRGVGTAGGVKG